MLRVSSSLSKSYCKRLNHRITKLKPLYSPKPLRSDPNSERPVSVLLLASCWIHLQKITLMYSAACHKDLQHPLPLYTLYKYTLPYWYSDSHVTTFTRTFFLWTLNQNSRRWCATWETDTIYVKLLTSMYLEPGECQSVTIMTSGGHVIMSLQK